MMLVWGPAEPCWGAWPSSEGFLRPLLVASFLFLRCSSSCLFFFSSIQLQSSIGTQSVSLKAQMESIMTATVTEGYFSSCLSPSSWTMVQAQGRT